MAQLKTVQEHLKDIKRIFFVLFIVFLSLFFLNFFVSEKVILFLIDYFSLNLVVLSPLEFVRTQLVVALFLTLAFVIPFIIIQLYIYLKEEIKNKNIKKLFLYFFIGIILALLGFYFGIFLFSKYSLNFFADLPQGLSSFWGVYSSITFIVLNGFAFALTAQTIIVIPLLVKWDLVKIETFKKSRKLIILLSLIVSALITSPDVFTQIMMSLPMFLCIEIGIMIASVFN